MISIKEYKKPESIEEAWQLNQKKSSCVIGGMLWLKMGHRKVQTAIDLSNLGLDEIEETEEEIRIGCMTTLRTLEEHPGLASYTNGAMKESLQHIVGVQFRNLATVGGSIYGRYGFSDVLTMFLVMDSYVELYKGGILSLEEFAHRPFDRDILVRIIIRKTKSIYYYQSVRNSKTDFPILTCSAARSGEGNYQFAIGARPGRAVLLKDKQEMLLQVTEDTAAAYAAYAKEQIETASNTRGSAPYRSHLVEVLVKRAITELKD